MARRAAAGSRAPGLDPGGLRRAQIGGLSTRYYAAGEAPAPRLVLVHGGQYGSWYSLDSWDTVLAPLARRFRVLALDRPGQGHTEAPREPGGYRWETGERHLEDFLQAVAGGPAHLVGHSRGALLVARLALARPDLALSLTLVDAGSLAPADPSYPRSERFYEQLPRPAPGETGPAAVRIEPEAQSVSTAHLTADFVGRLVAIAGRPDIRLARREMARLGPALFRPSLERARAGALQAIGERGLPVPTLILWGAQDPSTPARAGERLWELVRRATTRSELRLIERAGHYCFREQPAAFVREVIDFLGPLVAEPPAAVGCAEPAEGRRRPARRRGGPWDGDWCGGREAT